MSGGHPMMIKPIHPESGQPFTHPDLPEGLGGIVGWCGHRVAESEWLAGYRVCERDSESDYEPPTRTLVLVSYNGVPDALYRRDDGAAYGDAGAWRWFLVGDEDAAPTTWTSLARGAGEGGGVLTVLQATPAAASGREEWPCPTHLAAGPSTTRPRSVPARCVRRGDEVAFAPGQYGGPLTEVDHASDERARWLPVTRVRAGGDEPWLIEFGEHGEEYGPDDPVVVREMVPADVGKAALAERVRIVGEIRRHADKIRAESYTPSAGVALGAVVDSVADMVNALAPLVPVVVAEDEIAALLDRRRPLPAAEQPVGAIVAAGSTVAVKQVAAVGHGACWQVMADGEDGTDWQTDGYVDRLIETGAELLRGEVAPVSDSTEAATGFAPVPWDLFSANAGDLGGLPVEQRHDGPSCMATWSGPTDEPGEGPWYCCQPPNHVGVTHRASNGVEVLAEWSASTGNGAEAVTR